VTDPGGLPLPGVTVTFTLSIGNVPALTGEDTTDGSGRATYRTIIPKGATVGIGLGTAFVTAAGLGDASDRVTITIVK